MFAIAGGIILAILFLAFFTEILSVAIALFILAAGFILVVCMTIFMKESPSVFITLLLGLAVLAVFAKYINPMIFKKSLETKKLFETFSIESKLTSALRHIDDLLLAGYNSTTYEFRIRENQRRCDIPLNGFTLKLYKTISNSQNEYVDSSVGIYIEDPSGKEICRYSKVLNSYLFTTDSSVEDIQINNLSDELDAFISNQDKRRGKARPFMPKSTERSVYDDLNRIELGKKTVLISFDLLKEDGISVDKPKIIQQPTRFKVAPSTITNWMELLDESNNRVATFQGWKWEQYRYKDKIKFEYEEQSSS